MHCRDYCQRQKKPSLCKLESLRLPHHIDASVSVFAALRGSLILEVRRLPRYGIQRDSLSRLLSSAGGAAQSTVLSKTRVRFLKDSLNYDRTSRLIYPKSIIRTPKASTVRQQESGEPRARTHPTSRS